MYVIKRKDLIKMKVTRKTTIIEKEFSNIDFGETFFCDGEVYMKVDCLDTQIECDQCEVVTFLGSTYAINLETGKFVEFCPYHDFEICECELLVSE
jgi:hypothetical protein